MRRLLIVALALVGLLYATPAQAQFIYFMRPVVDEPLPGSYFGFKTAQDFVRWMGCKAKVVLWNIPEVNAMFRQGWPDGTIIILQGLREVLTHEEIGVVLAHEAGHCLQYQRPAQYGYIQSIKSREFDAEAHAHKILRVLGRDPALILGMRLKFARLAQRDPRWESNTHGSAYSIAEWARDHDGLGREALLKLTPGG